MPPPVPKNRIMIFGPKDDGTYVVEFRTAEGEALAISIPRTETADGRGFAHGRTRSDKPTRIALNHRQLENRERPLLFGLCAHHDERASSCASWATDCSFVDEGHRTSARTAVCDHKHLVLIAFGSAGCRRAIGTRNPNGV
jgi:hypothetical protein